MSMLYFKPIRELPTLRAPVKWLLFLIGDNANDDGFAWPGIDRLARDACMHKRTVQGYICTFEGDGVLVPHENLVGGRGKIKGWWIDIERAQALYGEGGLGFGSGSGSGSGAGQAKKDASAPSFSAATSGKKGGSERIKGGPQRNPPTPPYKEEPKEPNTRSPSGDLSAPRTRAPVPTHDLKSQIFGTALDWLAQQSGRPKDKLRSMVGRWCRDHGDGRVLETMTDAARCGPVEPVAWIERALKEEGYGKRFGNRDGPTAGQTRAAGILGVDLRP